MADIAINIKHLTKQYKVYKDVFLDRLREKLFFWKAEEYYSHLTALDDINLEIHRGEVLGVIGPNGAGKTTMLKILAKICYPTSGEVEVNGSLVAVLALGLGFSPRFTGRENIVVSGSLLGMSLEEIKEKEKWIISFSELGSFIDQPIRTYSSGMTARLSFSVAAAVSPQILIIDEALATGDAFFVQKSLGRIHEICSEGTTAIFVSHNLQQIQRLCSERVVLLEKGKVVQDDKAVDVLRHYNELVFKYREKEALRNRSERVEASLATKDYAGNGAVRIDRISFADGAGQPIASAKTGENMQMVLDYTAAKNVSDVRLVVVMENYSGICAFGMRSDNYMDNEENKLVNRLFDFKAGQGQIRIAFSPLLLTTNRYLVSVTLYDSSSLYDSGADYFDMTIFAKQHMAELTVLKPMDFNTSLVFEHPISITVEKK